VIKQHISYDFIFGAIQIQAT